MIQAKLEIAQFSILELYQNTYKMVVSKLSMLIENKIINALQCNASNK